MKNKKYLKLLAIGLLIMNVGVLSNLLFKTTINIYVIDFLKGLGVVLVVFVAYKIALSKRNLGTN